MKFGWLAAVLLINLFPASTLSAQIVRPSDRESPRGNAGRDKLAPPTPKLTVVVYDFAHLDRSALRSAREVATEIFQESGIEAEWFDCRRLPECDLHTEGVQFRLIIQSRIENVVTDHSQAKHLGETDTLGFAIPCNRADSACLFYIFYSPISSIASQYGASSAVVLGHVIVHEIGHALLGPDAHSRTGIMQRRFPIQALNRFLYFSARESKRARDHLSMRNDLINNSLAGHGAPFSLPSGSSAAKGQSTEIQTRDLNLMDYPVSELYHRQARNLLEVTEIPRGHTVAKF
jgi:hypothetical protein